MWECLRTTELRIRSLSKLMITHLLVIVSNPPTKLHHCDIIVQFGILVVGVLVDSLDLYHLLEGSPVPDSVHLDLR